MSTNTLVNVDAQRFDFTDQSTATPEEKARRMLRSLANNSDYRYFFDDGYPRVKEIAQDAHAALSVLENLESRITQSPAPASSEALSEQWFAANGFKWRQGERQPHKHWVLWLGSAIDDGFTSIEDLGFEFSQAWWKNRNDEDIGNVGTWHCWLLREQKFIHIRHMRTAVEVSKLFEALTGIPWNPSLHHFGNAYTAKRAAALRLK